MKAARYYGHKDIRVEDIARPSAQADSVLVKIAYAGICGTDRHEYTGPVWVPMDKPHRITGRMAPITLGHEFSGVIAAVGENVTNWQVGERVTASGNIYCGECEMCKLGRVNLCEKLAFNGVGDDGAFAEYMVVPTYQLYRIPDQVSLKQAVLAEPLACGWHATRMLGDLKGKNVAVVGPGIIGLSAVNAAREAGAGKIMVVGLGCENEAVARLMGATHYVDSREANPIVEGNQLTDKLGFDVVYECVGFQSSLDTACALIRKSGKLMVMGVFEKIPQFNMNIFQEGERTLYSSQAYTDEIRDILAMMGRDEIEVEKLITAVIPLERIVEDGFEELLCNPAKHIKIVVQVNALEK